MDNESRRQQTVREYGEFLRNKIKVARESMSAGIGHSNEKIEVKFSAKRAKLIGK